MFQRLLSRAAAPLNLVLALRRFGDIWRLKEHLRSSATPDPRLLAAYDAFFERHGAWIGYDSRLAGPPCFPHSYNGIFISGGASIGRNAVIFHQVTIGSNSLPDTGNPGAPVIGDNVYIGAGAKIIGGITIGDNCRIGANAVVYTDMPANCVAVQAPTRFIQREKLDNRFISLRNGKLMSYDDGQWKPASARASD